jgi:hypothetical protein
MSNRPGNAIGESPTLATDQLSMNECLSPHEGIERFNPPSEQCRGGSRKRATGATNMRSVEMVTDKPVDGTKAIYRYVSGIPGQ